MVENDEEELRRCASHIPNHIAYLFLIFELTFVFSQYSCIPVRDDESNSR